MRGAGWAMVAIAAIALLASERKKTMNKVSEFVGKLAAPAQRVAREFNLPVWLILTQAAHESAYALSQLTLRAFNLFGFTGEAWEKAGKPTVKMPTREFIKGAWVVVARPFRAYSSFEESMRDYAKLLTLSPRYAKVVAAARENNPAKTFEELGRSGYATDPTYGAKLAKTYANIKEFIA